MTQSPLTKRAYVRGLNVELIRSGAATYPSKEAADHAADYIADHSGMPDPMTQGEQITLKVAHALCIQLARAGEAMCKQAGVTGEGLAKTAAAVDPGEIAAQDAFAIMQKIAYENETPNTAENAARDNSQAALDQKNRPAGYAHSGQGNYEDKGQGAIGVETPADRGDQVSGNNSATENSSQQKAAFARAAERLKAASNPYTGHPNTAASAAKHNDQAALDKKNRPEGYAHTGPGNKSEVTATGSGVLGQEKAVHPSNTPGGSNTVSAPKTAGAVVLEKAAAQIVPFLPAELEDRKKVAHVRAMAPLSTKGRALYLEGLYGEKVASAFLKKAEEDEGEEAGEVAKAMEQAAEELESKSEKGEKSEKSEKGENPFAAKEAQLQRIRDAASRLV